MIMSPLQPASPAAEPPAPSQTGTDDGPRPPALIVIGQEDGPGAGQAPGEGSGPLCVDGACAL
ncbi:hypothetical protein SXIM_12290 [Streptomyces xiamenensis]|uniref:Uncharacterized protein n=2 Tax=Streptomyces xiamenensis TaxID=408015 RepID=A0A0F7FSQ1_9ACTN|nr:hypothetical protein SXIM_12290 [Streptomyces xiamenensis]